MNQEHKTIRQLESEVKNRKAIYNNSVNGIVAGYYSPNEVLQMLSNIEDMINQKINNIYESDVYSSVINSIIDSELKEIIGE